MSEPSKANAPATPAILVPPPPPGPTMAQVYAAVQASGVAIQALVAQNQELATLVNRLERELVAVKRKVGA